MKKLLKLATIFAMLAFNGCASMSKTASSDFMAAGFLFVCPDDNTILLGKRSRRSSEPGLWAGFGGGAKPNETPMETAVREAHEEIGELPHYRVIGHTIFRDRAKTYITFIASVSGDDKQTWRPKLNYEHDDAKWFSKLPSQLHYGVTWALNNLQSK